MEVAMKWMSSFPPANILPLLLVGFVGSPALQADTIEVGPGEELREVSVFGNDTLLVTGGWIEFLNAYDSSTVIITGGLVLHADVADNAGLGIHGGEMGGLQVGLHGYGAPIASLYGGKINSLFVVKGSAEIHGNDVIDDGYSLSGTWADGSPLTINHRQSPYRVINSQFFSFWSGAGGNDDVWNGENWMGGRSPDGHPDDDTDVFLDHRAGSATLNFSRTPSRSFSFNSLLIGDGVHEASYRFVSDEVFSEWTFSMDLFEVRRKATVCFKNIKFRQLTLPPGSTLRAGEGGHLRVKRLSIQGNLEISIPQNRCEDLIIAEYDSFSGEFASVVGLPPGWRIDYGGSAIVAIPDVPCGSPGLFLRGDTDADGNLNLTDVIRFLNFQFTGSATLVCLDAADINDDGELDLTDAIGSLNYQFTGTAPTPEPPGPFHCGPDVNNDAFPPCEYPAESCP